VKKSEEEAVEMAGDDEDVEAAMMRKMVSWHLLSRSKCKKIRVTAIVCAFNSSFPPL
jgi:hypothetical protein